MRLLSRCYLRATRKRRFVGPLYFYAGDETDNCADALAEKIAADILGS